MFDNQITRLSVLKRDTEAPPDASATLDKKKNRKWEEEEEDQCC